MLLHDLLPLKRRMALCCLILISPLAASAASRPSPKPQLYWVDQRGSPQKKKWPSRFRWTWTKDAKSPVARPTLKALIKVPPNHRFEPQGASGLRIKQRGRIIAVDVFAPIAKAALTITSPKRVEKNSLVVQFKIDKPLLIVGRDCSSAGVTVKPGKEVSRHLYTAFRCKEKEKHIDVYAVYSPDSSIGASTIKTRVRSGSGWIHYQVRKPDLTKKRKGPPSLGTIRLQKRGIAGRTSDYTLIYDGTRSKIRMNAGIGFTWMKYTETFTQVALTQIAMTAKFTASLPIIKNKLEISGNIFGNVFTLTHSPADIPPARFVGVNFRGGYILPFKWLPEQWVFSMGFYFWRMIVDQSAYGVSAVFGPQVFLIYRRISKPSTHRRYYTYLKWSPLSEKTEFGNFKDREFALGVGYQLSSPQSKLQWMGTVDFSNLQISSEEVNNSLALTTISLGVSLNL